ncbi:MAG: Acyl-CoA:1-acyl-sn-glycerol-3-phosphate acyltransferase, partial [uncultured Gemmatimonadaceae bacterium]
DHPRHDAHARRHDRSARRARHGRGRGGRERRPVAPPLRSRAALVGERAARRRGRPGAAARPRPDARHRGADLRVEPRELVRHSGPRAGAAPLQLHREGRAGADPPLRAGGARRGHDLHRARQPEGGLRVVSRGRGADARRPQRDRLPRGDARRRLRAAAVQEGALRARDRVRRADRADHRARHHPREPARLVARAQRGRGRTLPRADPDGRSGLRRPGAAGRARLGAHGGRARGPLRRTEPAARGARPRHGGL